MVELGSEERRESKMEGAGKKPHHGVLASLLLVVLSGCPEDATPTDGGVMMDAGTADVGSMDAVVADAAVTDAAPDAVEADAGPMDAGESDAGSMDTGTPPDLTGLVINELEPGDEWIELYNGASEAVPLGGYRITDSDEGMPRLDSAATFPDDFMLEPGAYLIVVENDPPTEGALSEDCAVGTRCLHTSFGLSASRGETIYILPPEGDDTPALSATLPPEAVGDGLSYCRFPNGTGDFQGCMPTPEASNATPD